MIGIVDATYLVRRFRGKPRERRIRDSMRRRYARRQGQTLLDQSTDEQSMGHHNQVAAY